MGFLPHRKTLCPCLLPHAPKDQWGLPFKFYRLEISAADASLAGTDHDLSRR